MQFQSLEWNIKPCQTLFLDSFIVFSLAQIRRSLESTMEFAYTLRIFGVILFSVLELVSCGKGGGGGKGGGKGGGGGEISGDIMSTLRIAARLCLGNHDDWVAYRFYACYDEAPGKPQFSMCQKKIFGALINTEANVENTCKKTIFLPLYAVCVAKSLRSAGINMNKALTKLNKCQGRVLGLK